MTYKPRLKKIFDDIELVSLVAEFSESDMLEVLLESDVDLAVTSDKTLFTAEGQGTSTLSMFSQGIGEGAYESGDETADEVDPISAIDDYPPSDNEGDNPMMSPQTTTKKGGGPSSPIPPRPNSINRAVSIAKNAKNVSSSTSARKIKTMLDRWSEPINKLDKTDDASIADILEYRKALTYMDDAYPFSQAFGEASTRYQCIKSAQRTFGRFLRGNNSIKFDVLSLALGENFDDPDAQILVEGNKLKKMKALFRPDKHDEVNMIAFIQACDNVYKRLRFFRASVGNASVIDHVLEGIIDGLFNVFLAVIILLLMKFNPYPILVSMSTLMVSFAFAFGPSASRYIEVSNYNFFCSLCLNSRSNLFFAGYSPHCYTTPI